MKERIAASDTVILLALSRFTCLFRVIKRGFKGRGRSRPDLHPGCIEKLPDREFLEWIWDYPKTRLPGVLQLLEGVMHEKRVVILRSNADVARFLDTLERGRTQGSTQKSCHGHGMNHNCRNHLGILLLLAFQAVLPAAKPAAIRRPSSE